MKFKLYKNKKNGGLYMLTEKKVKSEPGLWESISKTVEPSRDELKEKLTEAGVEFKGNAATSTLRELYNELP
jgi:hypothetical protein